MQPKKRKSEKLAPRSPAVQEVMLPRNIPTWDMVWPLLQKAGFTFTNGHYCLPGVDPSKKRYVLDSHYFANHLRLRRFLCAYGIKEGGTFNFLNQDDRDRLSLWVRTAIVPRFWGLSQNDIPADVRLALPKKKMHPLFKSLGFKYHKDGLYYLPNEEVNRSCGLSLNGRKLDGEDGLLVFLARFGLPPSCKFNEIDDTQRSRLEYSISQRGGAETL